VCELRNHRVFCRLAAFFAVNLESTAEDQGAAVFPTRFSAFCEWYFAVNQAV
jgi:hypothetical protein